jgi:DNA-binding transcriptional MocR family regulator
MGKNQWQRKKSTVFLYLFEYVRIASLKPCKQNPVGKNLSEEKKVQLAHILQKILLPLMNA